MFEEGSWQQATWGQQGLPRYWKGSKKPCRAGPSLPRTEKESSQDKCSGSHAFGGKWARSATKY